MQNQGIALNHKRWIVAINRIMLLVIVLAGLFETGARSQETNHILNLSPLNKKVTTDKFSSELKLLDAPDAPIILLAGSASGTKEVIGQNFTQNMTYSLEVSFKFTATNRTGTGEIVQYDLTNSSGKIHFFGQAVDVYMNETTILNFDHTYEYPAGTGNGILAYSTNPGGVFGIDFTLPVSNPDHFLPSQLTYRAGFNLLRVDILNFDIWMFDEDYWINAYSDKCTRNDSCPRPKALLISGNGTLPDNFELFKAASNSLLNRGWLPVIPVNPTLEDVQELINNDPCIRGLYIDSHASENGSIILRKRGSPTIPWKVLPSALAPTIAGSQLDFITILACYVRKSDWQAAFPQSRIVTTQHMWEGKYAYGPWDILMQKFFDYGTPLYACDQPHLLLKANLRSQSTVSQDGCASFAICDSNGCGADIYPVTSCIDSIGVPTASEFSVSPPDSMFSVTLHLPANNSDSVACAASYFSKIPKELLHPDLLPLGRFLVFADVEKDTLHRSDRITVSMKYLDSDLAQSGITDETKLVVYWTSADSVELLQVDVDLDTEQNRLTFDVPRWGLAGIYSSANVTGMQTPHNEDEGYPLHQNYPNPFTSTTTISFTLPEKENVCLEVFDMNGRQVRTLVSGMAEQGYNVVPWDGTNNSGKVMPSGTYFYQLRVGNRLPISKKAVLLK